jgi:hypothetical protein
MKGGGGASLETPLQGPAWKAQYELPRVIEERRVVVSRPHLSSEDFEIVFVHSRLLVDELSQFPGSDVVRKA